MHRPEGTSVDLRKSRGRYSTREGDKVRFRVTDIFLPSQEEVSAPLSSDTPLEGVVVGFSDSGVALRVFAMVEVVRRQTLVVPVEKMTIVPLEEPGNLKQGSQK